MRSQNNSRMSGALMWACFLWGIVLSLSFVMTSGQNENWNEVGNVNFIYPSESTHDYYYGEPGPVLRKGKESEEEIELHYNIDKHPHRRSATDTHGRSVLFKSLVLAPLALVVFFLLILLVTPIPTISSHRRRSLSTSPYRSTIEKAREVLGAEECVERISCDLSRISKERDMAWIPKMLEKMLKKKTWGEKILKGIQTTYSVDDPDCKQYKCTAGKRIKQALKANSKSKTN